MLVKETTRNLARIVKISEIKPIPKADRLEIAVVDGWECVVAKGLYTTGSEALYFEIDSAVPANSPVLANFDKAHLRIIKDEASGSDYAIIKTLRLRGALSQGLLLSPSNYASHISAVARYEGSSVAGVLGVLKYVSPQEASLYVSDDSTASSKQSKTRKFMWALRVRLMKGIVADGLQPFPLGHVKSDETRVQNIAQTYQQWREAGHTAEVTVKLNGESALFYSDMVTGKIGVAQRNFSLRTEDSKYSKIESLRVYLADWIRFTARRLAGGNCSFPKWKHKYSARSLPLVDWFFDNAINFRLECLNAQLASPYPYYNFARGMKISVQGEMIGPDFNGNAENVPENEFYVYRAYGNGSTKFTPEQTRAIAEYLVLKHVPVLDQDAVLPETIAETLKLADGVGYFDPSLCREGVVAKNNVTGTSFKIISNKWLEKEK